MNVEVERKSSRGIWKNWIQLKEAAAQLPRPWEKVQLVSLPLPLAYRDRVGIAVVPLSYHDIQCIPSVLSFLPHLEPDGLTHPQRKRVRETQQISTHRTHAAFAPYLDRAQLGPDVPRLNPCPARGTGTMCHAAPIILKDCSTSERPELCTTCLLVSWPLGLFSVPLDNAASLRLRWVATQKTERYTKTARRKRALDLEDLLIVSKVSCNP